MFPSQRLCCSSSPESPGWSASERDITAGALTSWKALGGPDRPIVAYQRDATSGSQVEMEQLVMRGRPMREGPDIRVAMTMFGPFNAIRHDPNGIGYSYHYYERFMAVVPEVATIAIDGVRAEPATIAAGRYPLMTFVYLAHRADLPAGSAGARLRDWLLTPAGQAVVAESGYVPLRPGPSLGGYIPSTRGIQSAMPGNATSSTTSTKSATRNGRVPR